MHDDEARSLVVKVSRDIRLSINEQVTLMIRQARSLSMFFVSVRNLLLQIDDGSTAF